MRETKIEFWNAGEAGALFCHAAAAPHQHDKHFHGMASVISLVEGEKTFHIGRRSVHLRAGQMVVVNPGEVHGCEALNGAPWAHRTVYVDPTLLRAARGVAEEATGPVHFPETVIDDPAIFSAFQAMHRMAEAGNDARDSMLLTLGGFARQVTVGPPPVRPTGASRRVALCQEYMHDMVRSGLGAELADLAALAGVTRFCLLRDFKAVLHMTPGDYMRSLRVDAARSLLNRRRRAAQVAAETGFADQAHLTREFKRIFGITPGRYSRAL
ncbi:AraC family transcriptional regulator [Salinarimonas ramus]|uniref:AraC family transcriptional regulator n=1 Tax=Salinarimonas ramus TaxID=690164 RepID=A0A917Q4C4_9HYPH|nr:helix-turn-helix domain-containing protein [Salinarimonas ramus]GGK22153.1 AraC family transcriptional regulator [Salinarimonas ramus]